MLNFNEFINESEEAINEAGERMTQDKWLSVFNAMDKKEWGSTTSFASKAKEMFGIESTSQKDYYKVTAAHKKFLTVAQGGTLPAKAPAKPKAPAAPKPMAQPKAAPAPKAEPKQTPKPVEIPKGDFDTKAYINALLKARSSLDDAFAAAIDIGYDFEKLRKNRNISNVTTPELSSLSNSVQDLKYFKKIREEIDYRIQAAKGLAGRVEAVRKADAKAAK